MFDYFKKVSEEAKNKGYVLFNTVVGRKFFFDFIPEFHKLESEVNTPGFWKTYKEHKNEGSIHFETVLKPLVKKYFKYKGIIERTSYNYPVQGSAADCTKYAAYLFYKYLVENNLLFTVRFVNIVHDEILVEAPDDIVEKMSIKLKECMEKAA